MSVRVFTSTGQAAAAAREIGAKRILKLVQDGRTVYVPVDTTPSAMQTSPGNVSRLPAAVLAQIELAGVDLRATARSGAVSAVPILLGALLGLYFDRKMPWGRGYGPVLGALLGNAARDGAVVYATNGGAAAAVAAFTAAALPVIPLAGFGWGMDLDDPEPGSPGCEARKKIAFAGAAFGVWALADRKLAA